MCIHSITTQHDWIRLLFQTPSKGCLIFAICKNTNTEQFTVLHPSAFSDVRNKAALSFELWNKDKQRCYVHPRAAVYTPNYKWMPYFWAILSLKKQKVRNSQRTETADSLFQASLQQSINCLINAAWCRKLNWRELILGKHISLVGEPLAVKLTAFGNAAAFVLGGKMMWNKI